jgi:hypothetical protein
MLSVRSFVELNVVVKKVLIISARMFGSKLSISTKLFLKTLFSGVANLNFPPCFLIDSILSFIF